VPVWRESRLCLQIPRIEEIVVLKRLLGFDLILEGVGAKGYADGDCRRELLGLFRLLRSIWSGKAYWGLIGAISNEKLR
jgi:hypothetical protein